MRRLSHWYDRRRPTGKLPGGTNRLRDQSLLPGGTVCEHGGGLQVRCMPSGYDRQRSARGLSGGTNRV